MKKKTMLKIVNPILGLLMINQFATGFLHDELDYETFEVLHGWGAILLLIFLAFHLILNWSWIKSTFFTKKQNIEPVAKV